MDVTTIQTSEWLTRLQVFPPDGDKNKWLDKRKGGVSATDIAAISGLNPYKTIYDVFLEKLDLVEPTPDNPHMRRGRRMEPVLAEDYEEETGFVTFSPGLLRNPEKPLAIGTPDRLVIDPANPLEGGKPNHGLEIKTAGIRQLNRWGEPGTDEVPEEYLVQCQWYMLITGLTRWDLIVSIAGEEPQIYEITRNDTLIQQLYERAEAFWYEHVLPKIPPNVDESESAAKMLAQFYSKADEDIIESDAIIDNLVTNLQRQRQFLKVAEDNVRYYENQIKSLIGDHEGVQGEWGRITWKKTKGRTDFDKKRFMAERPDIAKEYLVIKEGVRIFRLVSNNKEEE